MSEGRETALRAALQVMAGREIDTPDLLAIAEWLRSGRHPYDESDGKQSLLTEHRDALVRAAREVLDHPELQFTELDALREVVERVESTP